MKALILRFDIRRLASHLATLGLLVCLASLAADNAHCQQTYWPTNGWRTSSPESQGMDSATLVQAFEHIQQHRLTIHSLLIVRNGYVVLDAYFYPFTAGERHDVASVTKSITSTLIGISIGKGQLSGVSQPVLSVFRNTPIANRDKRKEGITVESLLTMTSGMGCRFSSGEITLTEMKQSKDWVQFVLDTPMPYQVGEHFEYCSPGMHLLSGVLSRVAGTSAFEFAQRELFAPLGITDVSWPGDANGVTHGWGDLQLRPLDMAKIGYLWLNNGRWNGTQIVPASYLHAASQVHSRAPWGEAYGYGIWVDPNTAGGLFDANGRGGQRIIVVPGKNLLVVTTGGGFEPSDIGEFLLGSLKSDQALPENPTALADLRAAVSAAAKPPKIPALSATTLPDFARLISGKVYNVGSNAWTLASFQLDFSGGPVATLELNFSNAPSEKLLIGLDGVPRLSGEGINRATAAGTFEGPNAFLIDYDQIARINHIEMRLRFEGNRVSIHLHEKTGDDQVDLSGQSQ